MVVELPHLQNLITSECSLWVQLNKYYNLTINLIFLLSKINLIHIWISYFNIPWLKLAKMRESAYLSSATLDHTFSLSISHFVQTLSLSISNFFHTLSPSISSFYSISISNLAQILSISISVLNFKACWIWNLDFEIWFTFSWALLGFPRFLVRVEGNPFLGLGETPRRSVKHQNTKSDHGSGLQISAEGTDCSDFTKCKSKNHKRAIQLIF